VSNFHWAGSDLLHGPGSHQIRPSAFKRLCLLFSDQKKKKVDCVPHIVEPTVRERRREDLNLVRCMTARRTQLVDLANVDFMFVIFGFLFVASGELKT
jgi:hypothetical protein